MGAFGKQGLRDVSVMVLLAGELMDKVTTASHPSCSLSHYRDLGEHVKMRYCSWYKKYLRSSKSSF